MNSLLLNVSAARIEEMFPGEADNLRRIAAEYRRLVVDSAVAYDKAEQDNEVYLARRAEKKRNRRAIEQSKHIMERMDRLENTIGKGLLLANHNTNIDLERICSEWASQH